MCNNVFCFSPTGKIIYFAINYLGSFHDSQLSVGLVNMVLEHLGQNLCGPRFPRSGDMFIKFLDPMSQRTRDNLAPVTNVAAMT